MNTVVSGAVHEDRVVSRRCDICGRKFEAPCYPRTGGNQMRARKQAALELKHHLQLDHTPEQLLQYVRRLHQV